VEADLHALQVLLAEARPLPEPRIPDYVRAIFGDQWEHAHVTGFPNPPDSFDTSTEKGRKASAVAWGGKKFGGGGERLLGRKRNNYVCVSTFRDAPHARDKRRRELFHLAHALMIDDVVQKVSLDRIGLMPTFALQTSEGSWQFWYVLSQPCVDPDVFDAVVNALVEQGLTVKTDPGMKGVTRYGRLPFGLNNKTTYGKPWPVRIAGDWENGPRYTLEQIISAFKLDVTVPTKVPRTVFEPEGTEELELAILDALVKEGLAPRGPIGQERRYSLPMCPWASEHTTGKGDAHFFGPHENNAFKGGFKCFHGHCIDKRGIRDLEAWLKDKGHHLPEPKHRFDKADFLFVAPLNLYLCLPTKALWTEEAVNKVLPWDVVKVKKKLKDGSEVEVERAVKPSRYIERHATVTQMTWLPGFDPIIENVAMDEGGIFQPKAGLRIANLYSGPRKYQGEATKAQPWCDHIHKLYLTEADLLMDWLAHRVQRPQEKVNYALVMCGAPGIGKDSIIEPVVIAVGPANVKEIGPADLYTDWNDYLQAVITRVSESHDTGEHGRLSFYNKTKRYLAAPPNVFDINSKNLKKFRIKNLVGFIYTSNEEGGGLYLPEDDRRHFVLWTEVKQEDFPPNYFRDLWLWYRDEGFGHVAAFLRERDLSKFDPKAPPPKTDSFRRVASANLRPANSLLLAAIEEIGKGCRLHQRSPEGKPYVVTWDHTLRVVERMVNAEGKDGRGEVEAIRDKTRNGNVIGSVMRELGYQALLKKTPSEAGAKVETRWSIKSRLHTIFGLIGVDNAILMGAADAFTHDQ
jgi:hypothetical protein